MKNSTLCFKDDWEQERPALKTNQTVIGRMNEGIVTKIAATKEAVILEELGRRGISSPWGMGDRIYSQVQGDSETIYLDNRRIVTFGPLENRCEFSELEFSYYQSTTIPIVRYTL